MSNVRQRPRVHYAALLLEKSGVSADHVGVFIFGGRRHEKVTVGFRVTHLASCVPAKAGCGYV